MTSTTEEASCTSNSRWLYFPLVPRGKTPLTSNGFKDASADQGRIEGWAKEYPGANWGIATGASDLFVIDVDTKSGKVGAETLAALEAEHGPLPETYTVETWSGGRHYYFRMPERRLRNSTGTAKAGLGPDVDTRGDGGYVVAPPSEVADGRKIGAYRVVRSVAPAELPGWVVAKLTSRQQRAAVVPPGRRPERLPVDTATGEILLPGGPTPVGLLRRMRQLCADLAAIPVAGPATQPVNDVALELGHYVPHQLSEAAVRRAIEGALSGWNTEGQDKGLRTIDRALSDGQRAPKVWTEQPPGITSHNSHNADGSHMSGRPGDSGSSGRLAPESDWDAPIPLEPRPLPPFPVEQLGQLGEFVAATADSLQVPPDLVAFSALATISTATGGRREVEVKPGWMESTALYLAALADSSEKKTPALNAAAAPLRAAEDDLIEATRPEVDRVAQEIRITQGQMAKAEQRAAGDKPESALADAEAARMKLLELGEQPELPRLLIRDATLEALAKRMAEQRGRIGSLASEGGIFKVAAGLYSSNGQANTDLLLEAYTGGPYTIDRASRAAARMPRTFLALGLIVQPGVVAGLESKNPEFRQNGLLGRFLYAKPPATEGDTFDSPPVPGSVASHYGQRIRDLVERVWARPEVVTLELSPGARALFADFYNKFGARRKAGGDLAEIADWAGKFRGQLIRVAACLELYEDSAARQISRERMAAVLAMAPYFIAHARAVFNLMGRDGEGRLEPMRVLLAWLRSREEPGAVFSARDAWQGLKDTKHFKQADDVHAALEQLEEYGWVAMLPPPDTSGRPGRKPSPKFEVHPWAANPPSKENAR